MKHRFGPRKSVKLDVELFDGQQSLGYFKTRNIGLEGLFIEKGPVDLGTSDLLDLTLTVNQGGIENYKLKGVVMHHSEEGVGVMFTDYEPIFFCVMDTLDKTVA